MKEYVTRMIAEEKQLRSRIARLARFVAMDLDPYSSYPVKEVSSDADTV